MKRPLILVSLFVLVVTACGRGRTLARGSPTPSPGATSTAERTTVKVYYLVTSRGRTWLAPEQHEVEKVPAIARAALEELVHGTAQDPDHTTPFPRSSQILDVKITGGTATVDWSAAVLEADVTA